ncbi:MAG: D-alanine--D-alanine ligase, partial [Flavobacteriales bacterium]|nr:D-alanine--D-alanine ligase [Flavobacteriales bacterium]MCB0812523.1 D-alanine--D-alanine ligase [Flavobacteriales bacterium]
SPGEDGRLQGFLDLLGIPYQTGGVLNTSLTFSKHTTTALLRQLGHPVAGSMLLHKDLPMDLPAIAQEVGIPCFVKPDRSGSSLGISRVDSEEALGS